MSRRRRILIACILVWSFLLCCAVLAHKWAAALIMLCLPAAAGVLFILGIAAAAVAAMHPRRRPAKADTAGGDTAVRVFPTRVALPPPARRRGRPHRAGRPGLTAAAAARVMAPDHDDFVALMRGAGAGDLEDVATPEDGDQ